MERICSYCGTLLYEDDNHCPLCSREYSTTNSITDIDEYKWSKIVNSDKKIVFCGNCISIINDEDIICSNCKAAILDESLFNELLIELEDGWNARLAFILSKREIFNTFKIDDALFIKKLFENKDVWKLNAYRKAKYYSQKNYFSKEEIATNLMLDGFTELEIEFALKNLIIE